MRVPKGKPVHENLSTSYVKVGALLADLQVREFTGYVHVGLRGYDAYAFIDEGDMIGALEQTEAATRTGSEAVDGLLVRSEQRDGTVSIYEHPRVTIQAIAGILDGTPVYQNLSSDFTSLDKLIRKLASERDSAWYLEFVATEGLGVGVIYVRDGQPDGVYSPLDSPTQHGEDALRTMLEVSEAFGATFDVYRAPVEPDEEAPAPPRSEEPPKLTIVPAETPAAPAAPVAPPEPTPAGPDPEAEVEAVAFDEADSFAPLVPLMSDVIAEVERVVAAREGAGAFAIELRSGLLEVADRYPFLDPFAAEFEYHAGEIVFVGNVAPEEFAAGIGEALHIAVSTLARRDPVEGERLRRRIAEALEGLYAEREDELEQYGLGGLLHYITDGEESDTAAAGATEAG
jgi:hypothetical protein